ncbi:MAG: hypothetical protein ACOX50_05275 [Patescibacteria group bacterium]|jgi:hypothetical protein
MLKDVPDAFEGIVEVDENYLESQKKNKSKAQLRKDKKDLWQRIQKRLWDH